MRLNKKLFAFSAVALLALAGCSAEDIVAKPTNYEDKLVNGVDESVVRNIESVVIDKLQKSSTSEVLDEVLFMIAEAQFGEWETVKADVAKAAFVAKVNERVATKMLAKAKLPAHSTRNKFSEYRFAMSLVKEFYKVNGTYDLSTISAAAWHKDVIFTPEITFENVWDEVLNEAFYQEYIELEMIPEIYRELLTEKHLVENDYRSLYLSRARKVNYIALKTKDEYPADAKYLLYEFIDQNIIAKDPAKPADLEILANAWRGDQAAWGHNEQVLLADAGVIGAAADDLATPYIEFAHDHTAFGDVLARFNKITDNPLTTDKSIEQEFTSSGAYTKEVGLDIKTTSVKMEDYTTDGWYVQYDGLKSLPEAIRTRLFSSKVERAVDYVLDDAGDGEKGGYLVANEEATRSSYVRNINGRFYLMPETYDESDDRNFIHYDASTKTYYIVEIEEAVNRTKFDAENAAENYTGLGKDLPSIVDAVAKVVGGRADKRSEATKYFIEKADLKFHDQAVYDFFVGQFPDLFGEDAKK